MRRRHMTVNLAQRKSVVWVLLLGALLWPAGVRAELPDRYTLADLKLLERAFQELAENVRPSVVAIQTYVIPDPARTGHRFFKIPRNRGSGFVIDSDGYIATNRHVLEDSDLIQVRLHDGRAFEATVRQSDLRSDLAVIKIDAQDLRPIEWGDLENLKVNQWCFAVGNPFGLAGGDGRLSITYGVVSALGRNLTEQLAVNWDIQYYGNLIETSTAINPGYSGGPLFNVDGEVIGIVTAIETSTGVNQGHGYAIPIDKNSRRIIDLLKAGKPVHYGFLGIKVGEPDRPRSDWVVNTRYYQGAAIASITNPDGPAARAGLKVRDIVIEFEGVPVENSDHLVRLVQFTPVGTEADVTFLRGNVKRKTTVTLGDRDEMLKMTRGAE